MSIHPQHSCCQAAVAGLWAFVIAAGLLVSTAATAQQRFRTYTVKPGDTCTSIAREVYGDPRAYYHIHNYNDLSDDGYACRPGSTLRLPILADQPEAKLMARAGHVRAKPPAAQWDPVDVGADLFEAWRVNTLERSRAQLGFRDNSEIQMTQNTLVVIYGPTKASARRSVARRATVERGRLKTRLADLSGQDVEVKTPQAKATFHDGQGQVTVDAAESRIANHTGKPAAVTGADGRGQVAVKAGQGTRVEQGKPPEKPRPLPPTPTWAGGFSPQALTFGGARATVEAAWQPVSAAAAYYVEVSRGRRQLDVMFSKKVPASIDTLQMRGLPPGDYFVSIVAIDADKFESIPSKLRQLRVLELGIDPGYVVDADAHKVVLGANLRPPTGMTCRNADAASPDPADSADPADPGPAPDPTAGLRLQTRGRHTIACIGNGLTVSTDLEAVKPTVTLAANTGESSSADAAAAAKATTPTDGGRASIAIRQGGFETVDLQFEPGLPPGVTARSNAAVDAKLLQVGPRQLRVNLTSPTAASPGPTQVDLYFEDVLLDSLPVDVHRRDQVEAPATDEPAAEYLLSALVGYDAVGVDPYWAADLPAAGASVEVGLGTAPTRYFAGEARVGLSVHPGDNAARIVGVRGQAMVGQFEMAAAPYAGLGLGWQALLGQDHRFSARPSLGVMPAINKRLRLRAELGVALTPTAGELRLLPEARAGVAFRF